MSIGIIDALVKGDESRGDELMHFHLDSVANRALVAPARSVAATLDILAPYAEEGDGGRVVKLPKVVQGEVIHPRLASAYVVRDERG